MSTRKLTRAQLALFERIKARGGTARFNGRAKSMVEGLARAGLVRYKFDLRPSAIGKWTEIYIVELTGRAPP